MFRPYPDEVPWSLLAQAGVDEETLERTLDLDLIRVAKHDGQVLGCYGIRPESPICYELVALAVARHSRGRGLGRWLLGHAIGIAESKGAREIVVRRRGPQPLLSAAGFVPADGGLLLTLTPE
ncbi:MAG: GNAT family N-acetyltransferase [Pseudomonadales bacterium]